MSTIEDVAQAEREQDVPDEPKRKRSKSKPEVNAVGYTYRVTCVNNVGEIVSDYETTDENKAAEEFARVREMISAASWQMDCELTYCRSAILAPELVEKPFRNKR